MLLFRRVTRSGLNRIAPKRAAWRLIDCPPSSGPGAIAGVLAVGGMAGSGIAGISTGGVGGCTAARRTGASLGRSTTGVGAGAVLAAGFGFGFGRGSTGGVAGR